MPTPSPQPQPQPGPGPDRIAPVITALRLDGRASRRRLPALRVALSEAARLRVVVRRSRRGRSVVSGRTAPLAARRTLRVALRTVLRRRALRAGTYRVEITPTDAAGNRGRTRTLVLRVR